MKPSVKPAVPAKAGADSRWFAALLGCFLGLCLLKFGNPPIMEKWVTPPGNIYEFVLGYPWPITWAYGLLAVLAVAGWFVADWNATKPRWLLALPAAWLAWQIVAGASTVAPELTKPTLAHFAACAVCFYLGFFCLRTERNLGWFCPGLVVALLLVGAVGWEQHFGGLKATREYFFLYIYPKLKEVPPEYLKKMSSSRIFATLFYPNALAGAELLGLPLALGAALSARRLFTVGARLFLAVGIAVGSLGCLYWSGSKGGWLLMLFLGLLALLRVSFSRRIKLLLVSMVLLVGLVGFFWRYAVFFEKGATSVSARFDYWRAALRTAATHPLFGTGPGTFARPYERIKRPESEMARLTHNDYLEQASDSGIPGFLLYSLLIVGGLGYSFPTKAGRWRAEPAGAEDVSEAGTRGSRGWMRFAVWLGVLGWALQGLVEFSLYIPALAWLAFCCLGWLVRVRNAMDIGGSAP